MGWRCSLVPGTLLTELPSGLWYDAEPRWKRVYSVNTPPVSQPDELLRSPRLYELANEHIS